MTRTLPGAPPTARHSLRAAAPWIGVGAALVLPVAAVVAPRALHWQVHAGSVPPLLADWAPKAGPGTLPALAIGAATVAVGGRLAERAGWRALLAGSFLVAAAWIVSLATVDGVAGISRVFDNRSEYLGPAREVADVGAMLRGFIDRIPLTAPDHWPVHVAGHPPGALLIFVLLVRLGLGTGLASGLVAIAVGATIPAAVLICLRRLGAEGAARRAAPFVVVGPAAVWVGVSADAMFGAVAAWGLCCLAVATTTGHRRVLLGAGAAAGLLLGCSVFLSYGLPLLGLLAVAVLVAGRSWRSLPVAAAAALAVVVAFAAAGFAWWDAYPVLVERYWAGIATKRPALYWVWANLAVLAISAGPAVGAGVAAALARVHEVGRRADDRPAVLLTLAAVGIIALADASGLSRSEVERIWQPFLPWLLVGTALLGPRWRRVALAANVLTALAVELLLHTAW